MNHLWMLTIFFSPFPPFLGCFATWCPCIVYSRNRQHLRSLQYQGITLPSGTETNDAQCCMYCGLLLVGYGWVLQVGPGMIDKIRPKILIRFRWRRFALARKSASAMAFVAARWAIALSLGAATLVLSCRSAGRLNWKRETLTERGITASIWGFHAGCYKNDIFNTLALIV